MMHGSLLQITRFCQEGVSTEVMTDQNNKTEKTHYLFLCGILFHFSIPVVFPCSKLMFLIFSFVMPTWQAKVHISFASIANG